MEVNNLSLAHLKFHQPVLEKEVMRLLAPKKGETLIDATVGTGGHLLALLKEVNFELSVVAIDENPTSLKIAKERILSLKKNLAINFVAKNFRYLKKICKNLGLYGADMILFDLGVASWQFEDESLGLSFKSDSPLDMRLSRKGAKTAYTVVNLYDRADLERVIRDLAEEKEFKKIADRIIRNRPIYSTLELAKIVSRAKRERKERGRLHPATKVFLGIRIEVNEELPALEEGLEASLALLNSGGRLAVISYHSLEDRIVKERFKEAKKEGNFELLTKKPLVPSKEEIRENPRARSAKLRVIKKIK